VKLEWLRRARKQVLRVQGERFLTHAALQTHRVELTGKLIDRAWRARLLHVSTLLAVCWLATVWGCLRLCLLACELVLGGKTRCEQLRRLRADLRRRLGVVIGGLRTVGIAAAIVRLRLASGILTAFGGWLLPRKRRCWRELAAAACGSSRSLGRLRWNLPLRMPACRV
jgi:hypothetical protein